MVQGEVDRIDECEEKGIKFRILADHKWWWYKDDHANSLANGPFDSKIAAATNCFYTYN